MNDEKDIRMTVINDEYSRVLSNPDNIIVSEDLQELIDLPIEGGNAAETADIMSEMVDTATFTLFNDEDFPVTARGELSELSLSDNTYSLGITAQRVNSALLGLLESACRQSASTPVVLSGIYEVEASVDITSWCVKLDAPHQYTLTVKFRSEDVIF